MRWAFILLFFSSNILAQTDANYAFKYYSLQEAEVVTSLNKAISKADKVFKLDARNEEAPKNLKKLGKLTNLQVARFSNNGLDSLPTAVAAWGNLIYFESSKNPLVTLPSSIENWQSLLYITLADTKLDSLPVQIGAWYKLKEFTLRNSQTTDTLKLPKEIGYWQKVTRVTIENVILDTLTNHLAKLASLEKLTLSNCGLNLLPHFWVENKEGKVLGNQKLKELDVSNNNLTTLPYTLFYCRQLSYLNLANNKLTALPYEICLLKNLAELDLRGNTFTPQQLAELKCLLPNCVIRY